MFSIITTFDQQRRLWIKKMIFLTSALCFSMKAPLSSRTLCWSSSTWHKKQTVNNIFDNILKTVRLYWAFFLQQTMFHKVRDNNLGPRSPRCSVVGSVPFLSWWRPPSLPPWEKTRPPGGGWAAGSGTRVPASPLHSAPQAAQWGGCVIIHVCHR